MKAANILRKIFLTIATMAVIAFVLMSIYFISIDDIADGTHEAVEFAKLAFAPMAIFVFGVIVGESKQSWAHKAGIATHFVASLALLMLDLYLVYERFVLNNLAFDRFMIPIFVLAGGLVFYYFSFIFQAVESSKKAKLSGCGCGCGCECGCGHEHEQCSCSCEGENQQCSCGCDQQYDQYYEQPEQQYYEQPTQEQSAPSVGENKVEQSAPQVAPYPYPPYPPYGYPAPMYGMPMVQPTVVQVTQPTQSAESKKEEKEVKVEHVQQQPSCMPEDDVHVSALMKWKKLYLEGIITEREFIRKRDEILNLRK